MERPPLALVDAGPVDAGPDPICYANAILQTPSDIAQYAHCVELHGDLLVVGSELTDLRGLEKLEWVSQRLLLEDNPALTSLAGLDSLYVVGGERSFGRGIFRVRNNPALTSLDALAQLTVVIGTFEVTSNHALAQCEADALYARILHRGQTVLIEGNDPLATCTESP